MPNARGAVSGSNSCQPLPAGSDGGEREVSSCMKRMRAVAVRERVEEAGAIMQGVLLRVDMLKENLEGDQIGEMG